MSELCLNVDLINRCNNASQFNAGTGIVAAAEQTLSEFDTKFGNLDGLNEAQTAYIVERREKYIDFINEVFNEQLNRRANLKGVEKHNEKDCKKRTIIYCSTATVMTDLIMACPIGSLRKRL